MSDVYIYFFNAPHGRHGEISLSARPATLAAIKGRGEAVMQSQLVVDHTQLDAEGFLAAAGNAPYAINDIVAQISSLEVRAASRDSEAIGSTNGAEKYMLSLESRELRKQARNLESRRADLTAGELSYGDYTSEFCS